MNYPTPWQIANAHGPSFFISNWSEKNPNLQPHKENAVIVIWEREIAAHHIEQHIEQIDLTPPK
jgi:hypothetical protein